MKPGNTFSDRVLAWFDIHGRKNLPWQNNLADKTLAPYRVWVSEIMLQQTQVSTVIPYYHAFMKQFPTLASLAAAPVDEVLHLWSGLGYYTRARNLHKSAQVVMERYQGRLPDDVDTLSRLPGIGRSTAGAIISIAYQKKAPILDGNVKRVLSRHFAIEGIPTETQIAKKFWQCADANTPTERVADYTQAIMDLGATLCTSKNPRCQECPLHTTCIAYRENTIARFPFRPTNNKKLPVKAVQLLLLQNAANEVLLEQRPPQGIWGGLWSLPELAPGEDPARWCRTTLGLRVKKVERWPLFVHSFSHFHLSIEPVLVVVSANKRHTEIMEDDKRLWVKLDAEGKASEARKGVPKPVSRLLNQLGKMS